MIFWSSGPFEGRLYVSQTFDDPYFLHVIEHAKTEPNTREGVEAVLALEQQLKDEPEFSKPRMIVNGRGGHGWLPQFAAQKMLSLVRGGRGADAAVAWLRKAPSITMGSGGAITQQSRI